MYVKKNPVERLLKVQMFQDVFIYFSKEHKVYVRV